MNSPSDSFATPRVAAGALFVNGDEILLVHKTYGNPWDLPGGYVDRGESPAGACEREVREELGLTRTARRLLVHDWAPSESEGDKILYVFDCGPLGDDRIQLDGPEIDRTDWIPYARLGDYVIPRLERRIHQALRAYRGAAPRYLEHGRPRPGMI